MNSYEIYFTKKVQEFNWICVYKLAFNRFIINNDMQLTIDYPCHKYY